MGTETWIRFEGGPLDGVERRKTSPARHPLYRDLDGNTIPTATGHRMMCSRSAGTTFYRLAALDGSAPRRLATYRFVDVEESSR